MNDNIIDISEVLLNSRAGAEKIYTVNLLMDKFKVRTGEYEVTDKTPIDLLVTSPTKNKLHIEGEVSFTLLIPCDRCLEIVKTPMSFRIIRNLSFNNGKVVPPEDMEDVSYVDGFTIDIDKMLYNEILINMPMKVLCSEDCKGICNRCGMNLNKGTCDCDTFVPDPRMSVISDIFKSFEN